MKSLYIPYSVLPALKAADVALHGTESAKKLTSLEELVGILSPVDVAFYWYINLYARLVMPQAMAASFTCALREVSDPSRINTSDDPRIRLAVTKFQEYVVNDSAPALVLDGRVLTCSLLDENTVVFTHRELADGEAVPSEDDIYDRVIETLNSILPLEEIATMPLFAGYLQSSQKAMNLASAENQ